MTSTNTFISFQGNSSGCTQSSGTCSAGETVTLTVSYFGYDVTCATHTYSWSFGGSTQSVNHTFNTTTQVAVTINNGSQSFQATATIPVGGSAPPPTPPPPSGGCATMTSANTFISFSGASSGCTQVAGTCSAGETVTLSVSYFGYNPSCATHSYSWSFGGSSQTVTHSFNTTTSVSVIVNNGSQSFTATANVPVGSSTPPPTPPPSGGCPTLIPGTSVYVSYLGSQSGCTRTAGDCTTAETIQFEADTFFYDFSCATHTFDWDYGDGTTHGTGKATTHQYVTAGAWPVRLKVTVNGQTYTMSQTVNVVPGAPYPFDFTTDALVGTNIPPYTYVFKAYSPTGLSANAYYWDFGDGNTCQKDSCGPTQTHTYADSKNYAVTLSVPGHSGSVQHNLKERHRPSEHP